MRHDKASMNAQRKFLAWCGFWLPIVSVLFGLPFMDKNGPDFWCSISATYYATSGDIMRFVLGIFGFFLILYAGYDLGDDITCTFSGAMALLIIVFPCKTDAAGLTTGIFNLPTDISHVIHCIVAALLFGSFAYMIGFRFTKSDMLVRTTGKKKRDIVYFVCAIIIVLAMGSQAITSFLGVKWMTIVNETIMLWSFSTAWIVKTGIVKKWKDD